MFGIASLCAYILDAGMIVMAHDKYAEMASNYYTEVLVVLDREGSYDDFVGQLHHAWERKI